MRAPSGLILIELEGDAVVHAVVDHAEANAVDVERFSGRGRRLAERWRSGLACGAADAACESRGRRSLRRTVDQLVAQGAEIAAAGTAAVVPVAGRTGPGMKIAGRGKILADQVRSDRLLVVGGELAVLRDQRTVGLDGKDGLADGPDRQRIKPAADDAQNQGDADRGPDVAENRTAAVIGCVDRLHSIAATWHRLLRVASFRCLFACCSY